MKEPVKEPVKEPMNRPSPKEGKVFFGYYFDRKLKEPQRDSTKELIQQFSMTNISNHVYFS